MLSSKLNVSVDYHNNTIFFLFIFISFVLLFMINLNIIFTGDLVLKIDEYVTVYNHFHVNKN